MQAVKEGAQDCLVKGVLTPKTLARCLDCAIERNRLRVNTSLLAMIVESSDDAIIGKTLDGTIVSWNRGAERMYGYSAAEAIGSSISMLVPGGAAEELDPIFEKLRRGERIEHYETVRVRKDGESIHVSLSIFPIFDLTGKPVGAATIARDITKDKMAEDALRRSRGAIQADRGEHRRGLLDFRPGHLRNYLHQSGLRTGLGTHAKEPAGKPHVLHRGHPS